MKGIELSAQIKIGIKIEKKIKKTVNKEIDTKINNLFKNNNFFKLKSNKLLNMSQDLIIICLNNFLKVIDLQVFCIYHKLSTTLFYKTNQSHNQ